MSTNNGCVFLVTIGKLFGIVVMISSTTLNTIKLSRSFSSSSSSSSSIQNLIKRNFPPTLNSINQFLLFLLNAHKCTLIPHFLSQMNRNQIQANFQTHSLFVFSLLKLNKFDDAEHFIKTHMAKPSHYSRSRKLWDSLIQSICNNKKDPDKALLLLVDCLRNYGVLPSSFTFSSVIQGFVLQGNMSSAIQVLELMNDENVKYPFCNFICSSIISGFCKIGKPELAMSFFENAINVGALKPNLVTYSAVVCSLCMLDRVDEVCGLVCEMEKEGLAFDVIFYSSWIYGYFRDGVIVEAIRKHREMVGKGIKDDVISYTILIDGFSKEGLVEKATGFLHKMISNGLRPNLLTYFAIMLGFCRKGKMDEALEVFKMVQNLGIELDEFVYAILVDGFCLRGYFDRAYALIQEMERTGITPTIVAYNTLINRLCKAGRTADADEFSKVIQGDNITYSALLHGYISEGNCIGVLEVKRRLEEAEVHMDVIMCNIIIKALFMTGDFEDVHVLYKRMQETNVVANSVTYCTMIDGYFKVGQIDKAFEIFDEFRHRLGSSVECYNHMIGGLCKNGMADMAAEIFFELNEKCLPLDAGICMILMKAILKEGGAEGVLNLIYRIENLRLKINDTMIWNYAIKLLSERNLSMAANEVCMVAKRNNLVLTSKSYYLIIKGLIGNGEFWASKLILGSFLKEFGLIEPKVSKTVLQYLCLKDVNRAFTFLSYLKEANTSVTIPISALRVLVKNGRVLDAYKFTVDAKDDLPVMDVIDYSIMVDGLCKGGHPIKALDLCLFAEKKGITLNIVTYNSIINGLCGQGCLMEAFRLFDSLERIKLIPSEITYSTLIDTLCKEGYCSDAKQLSERMVLKGYRKNIHIYNSFINGYCKFGQFEEALKILKVTEMECLDIEEFTVSSMINGYCQKGEMEGALTFYSEYKQKGVSPDFLGFLYLIRGLFTKGRMEEARSILREMLQSRSALEVINRVNTEVETESVESFLVFLCEQGSIKEAVAVLNEIGSMFFPGQKWFGLCEPQEQQEFSDSEVSNSTSFNVINVGKLVEGSDDFGGTEMNCFDSYYSAITSLCSSGELGKANRFAKEILASWD